MRCCKPSCGAIGTSSLMDEPPPREGERPGALSTYRRFWSGATEWERFLLPGWEKGPALQKTRPQPGVYEFGISMPQAPSTVVPVYIGQSVDVRQRHLAYGRDGDHIRVLMAPMVEDGHTIWQRVRYLVRLLFRFLPCRRLRSLLFPPSD